MVTQVAVAASFTCTGPLDVFALFEPSAAFLKKNDKSFGRSVFTIISTECLLAQLVARVHTLDISSC